MFASIVMWGVHCLKKSAERETPYQYAEILSSYWILAFAKTPLSIHRNTFFVLDFSVCKNTPSKTLRFLCFFDLYVIVDPYGLQGASCYFFKEERSFFPSLNQPRIYSELIQDFCNNEVEQIVYVFWVVIKPRHRWQHANPQARQFQHVFQMDGT